MYDEKSLFTSDSRTLDYEPSSESDTRVSINSERFYFLFFNSVSESKVSHLDSNTSKRMNQNRVWLQSSFAQRNINAEVNK